MNLYAYVDSNTINLRSLSSDEYLPFSLTEGSLPESNNEVVVPEELGFEVGDTIELNLGYGEYDEDQVMGLTEDFDTSDTTTQTFIVTGVYESTTLFDELNEDFYCIYSMNQESDSTLHTIILYDSSVHSSDTYDLVTEMFDISENDIYLNTDTISYDTIRNYLKDTTTLLMMFVVIIVLAVLISIISLRNVFITSDKDRKKEIGLLKSIGATGGDIKRLLIIELSILGLIGSFFGIVLGLVVSQIVITLFTDQLTISVTTSMVVNPALIIVSFIVGFIMLLGLGFGSYKQYIVSNPIDDLKENTYNYDPPVHKTSYTAKSFSWKMFLIYNGRLKAQTRNIFYSFALLIMTTTLFFALLYSNFNYQQEYSDLEYDMYLSSLNDSAAVDIEPSIELSYYIYDEIDEGNLNVESILTNRYPTSFESIYYPIENVEEDDIDDYKSSSRVAYDEKKYDGDTYGYFNSSKSVMDDRQLEEAQEIIEDSSVYTEGSVEDLKDGGVLLILYEDDVLMNDECAVDVGDIVLIGDKEEEVKAIIYITEDDEFAGTYYDYTNHERTVVFDYDYFIESYSSYSLIEKTYITLQNQATSSKANLAIERSLEKSEMTNLYQYDNLTLTVQENQVTAFLIESLFYPLFLMLFVISVMNINNVLIGNTHLKRGDISILKSVGMDDYQLYKMMAFEYAEGYLNASALICAIFIPLCIIEGMLGLTAAFSLGENIFATLITSIVFVDLIIVMLLVVLSLRGLKNIDAIENMKNIT